MVQHGLDNVVAAETRLSDVDGERGELIIAGFPVGELAARATFEETTWLLGTVICRQRVSSTSFDRAWPTSVRCLPRRSHCSLSVRQRPSIQWTRFELRPARS